MNKLHKIELDVKCTACKGTGVYAGMAERDGAGVVCRVCKGTGCSHFTYEYELFNGIVPRNDISRVYLSGYGYVIAPTKLKIGKTDIDFQKEGVSYYEFLNGKMPTHIEEMACPMQVDQGSCHDISGFVDTCNENNGSWIFTIADCKHQCKKHECWKRFNPQE